MRPQTTLRVILSLVFVTSLWSCAQMGAPGLGGAGGFGAKNEKADHVGVDGGAEDGSGSGVTGLPSGGAADDNLPPKQDAPGKKDDASGSSFSKDPFGKKKDIQLAQGQKPQEIFGSPADPGGITHLPAMVMGTPPYDPKGGQCPSEVYLRVFNWPDVTPEKMSEDQASDFIKDVRYRVTTKAVTWDDFKGSFWREMKVSMQQVQGECQLAGAELDEVLPKLAGVYLMFWRPANIIPIVSTQATTPEEFKLFFPPPPPSPLKDKKTPPENY